MLVFPEKGLVLMAVPKTGTTALEGVLAPRAAVVLRNPPDLKHMPVYRYRRFFKPLLEKCGAGELETVAMVRHPVAWLGSWFKYRSRPDLNGLPQSTAGLSFDDFVKGYLRDKRPPFADVGSQAKFLMGDSPQVMVDHLFRYEAMDALIAFLQSRLETEITPPRKNVSPPRETPLSPGVKARLRKKFPAEFAVWEGARAQ